MRAWVFLLGGLLIWAGHFFALYAIASVLLTTPAARLLALAATLVCLLADGLVLTRALRRRVAGAMEGWIASLAAPGAALSALAVLWQGLPAILA